MRKCHHCKKAHYCHRHKKIVRLLHRDELPRSMWVNEHIHTGYRPTNLSLEVCIRSAFQWNNETINIWSHLLGFIYFAYMQWNTNINILPALNAPFIDHLITTLSVAGAQACMILSVLYHTFGCIGVEQHDKWLRADVFGISAGLIGMYLSGIYMSFYCFSEAMNTYFAALLVIVAVSVYVPTRSQLRSSKLWGRIGYLHLIYGMIVMFGFYPAVHWIQLHDGFDHPHVIEWLPRLVILFVLVAVAFLFYASLIPERLCPGKFDIVGCSHQWWHIIILGAMVYWHEAGVRLLVYYHSMPTQCAHIQQPILKTLDTVLHMNGTV